MMEVIKTEFAQILRGYFAEIKLNYVNMNGLKTVYQVAISLASEEGYIAASDDQKKVMRDQNFEEAWRQSLSNFYTKEQKESMKEIFWRNLVKLFKGRVRFLPSLEISDL